MKYRFDERGDTLYVNVSDVLTFEDHEVFNPVIQEIEDGPAANVVVDLQELKTVDSAGIGLLLLANDRAKKKGKSFKISNLQGHVAVVAELFKFDQLVDVIN
ncbi:STAS domain-containing protein [Hirschia baltica]|uniref:Anti-sigma-factor antagonist n=1 Tax=Hirschia baltica (strain ATCC 49814 / DSM 5838 / IFAM 1418) TaxID=582402 RepID=C6XM13_HIRBI|nr:STAS domain-containing protein [Hirschia baltica]ACT59845.1 anti-sigma-factor antagonist [Hirschia baltica ATCC 49814]